MELASTISKIRDKALFHIVAFITYTHHFFMVSRQAAKRFLALISNVVEVVSFTWTLSAYTRLETSEDNRSENF
ncbi:hypothetical protein K431DRAFT_57165 [Polychaeton citri CBS 116435]|uniref:Uncharacterized protein n=1 Tax=Polychaeton citri CBS 116435 TaxID=1314669 RepID=A0A9P4URL4_9PEZI|nr:hypothetical protein K431DRAFT_57165 [Polychaeton citri CBS 116435]